MQFLSYLVGRGQCESLKVPSHMAIAFDGGDYVDLSLLCDVILYAAHNSIQRLSFFDPYGYLEQQALNLETQWHEFARKRSLSSRVLFNTDGVHKNGVSPTTPVLRVHLLSSRHAKAAIVAICAEMSQSQQEITIERVNRQLEQRGIYEVDFLVTVGRMSALHGYPPWALRAAEVYASDGLANQSYLRKDEFQSLLTAFSQRDRRLGH